MSSTGPATTLQLTLTNAAGSKQTLGSANFTAPDGDTNISVVPSSVTGSGGFAVTAEGNVVGFSSTVPLKKTEAVSANVLVTTTSGCQDATWTVQSKQSNDFSGSGNDFAQGTSTNLRPLGSLAIADIGTEVDDPDTPAVEPSSSRRSSCRWARSLAVTAYDICGVRTPTTDGARLSVPARHSLPRPDPAEARECRHLPHRLDERRGSGAGTGTATLTPADVETGDHLVLSDQVTEITARKQRVRRRREDLHSFDDTCHWDNSNKKIHVDAQVPPPGASLGVGFSSNLSGFSCNDETDVRLARPSSYVNPRDYRRVKRSQ